MKVLFVGSAPAPTAGGAHGFISTVTDALKAVPTTHAFSFGAAPAPGYDFTWFLSPDGKFAQCTTPFAFSVWDLGHRMLPWFPEVSLSGWKFDSREQRYREALPRAAIVVVSSTAVGEQVHTFYGIPQERILVNREPPSPYFFEPDHGDDTIVKRHNLTFSKYLLYPAQFWPHKNHITALETLKHLPEDYRLVFTGADKGNRKHVFNRAREWFPVDRVVFADFVTVQQLKSLYLNAHAALICTLMPARSLPVFEAQACGCPVVRVDWNNRGCAAGSLVFPSWKPESAAHLVQQLEAPARRAEMVELGRQVVNMFTAEHYARTVVEALNRFEVTRRLWGEHYVHL